MFLIPNLGIPISYWLLHNESSLNSTEILSTSVNRIAKFSTLFGLVAILTLTESKKKFNPALILLQTA